MKKRTNAFRTTLCVSAALAMLVGACGSDGDDAADTPTTAGATTQPAATTTPASESTEGGTDTTVAGGDTTVAAGDDAEFQAKWAELQTAAKEEGELVMVTSTNVNAAESKIFEKFGETFGLKITQSSGNSAEVNARVLAERSQGLHTVDVAILGTSGQEGFIDGEALTPLAPLLIEPSIQDRSLWYVKDFPWLSEDSEQKYVSEFLIRVEPNIFRSFYNSDNVTEDDLANLKSFWDLVENPRWKGKVVVSNVASASSDGTGSEQARGWLEFGGDEFYDRLFRENPPTVMPEGQSRQMVDGIARGDWDICIFCPGVTADATAAAEAGLPVAPLLKTLDTGPNVDLTGHFSVFDQAPHPAAAQLFVNWILSKDGQTAVNELLDDSVDAGALALRSDIPQLNRNDTDWGYLHNPDFVVNDLVRDPKALKQATEDSGAFFVALFAELGITPG